MKTSVDPQTTKYGVAIKPYWSAKLEKDFGSKEDAESELKKMLAATQLLEALQDAWRYLDGMEPNLSDHEKAIKKRIYEAIKMATE